MWKHRIRTASSGTFIGWDLKNPFNNRSCLGATRKVHKYIEDALAVDYTIKNIENDLMPLASYITKHRHQR